MAARIYLDNNASTPIDTEVLKYYISINKDLYGNPSSIHYEGRLAKSCLIEARKTVASCLGQLPQAVFFFPSATEALNTALLTILRKNPAGHVVTSDVEHPAVFDLLTLESKKREVTFLSTGDGGAVAPSALEQAIRPDTCLVTLMSVNNETGVMTDLEGIAQVCKRRGVPLIVDAVAHLGRAPLQIPSGVSCIVLSGHKIHAPKGGAIAVIQPPFRLEPLLFGGPQELTKRPGTENVAAYAALAKALEIFKGQERQILSHLQELRDRFEARLIEQLPDMQINGNLNKSFKRSTNTSNLTFMGADGETLLMQLDMLGLAASHGSACASGSLEPSRVLTNMGYSRARVLSSIRFSFGRQNTFEEVDQAVAKVMLALGQNR